MKKFFKEHELVKIISLVLLLILVLSWIIPNGYFSSGGTFVEGEIGRLGLAHIFYGVDYAMYNYVIQIGFLLMIGIFYGVVSKTKSYQELVRRTSEFGKRNAIVFALVVSFIITILASFINNTMVLLIFMPFLVSVLRQMGLSKMSAFATTFGSLLVGVLGATIGTEGLDAFVGYIGYGGSEVTLLTNIEIRLGILALAYILFSFFNVMYIKKTMKNKDLVEELTDDAFYVVEEETKEKKGKTSKKKKQAKIWPTVLMFVVLLFIVVLGFTYWNTSSYGTETFGIELFDNIFENINSLAIGEVNIIEAIFGAGVNLDYLSADLLPTFGSWYLFDFSIFIALILIIVKFASKMKFNDMLTYAWDGIKAVIKPILLLVLAYVVFVFIYWSEFFPTIINAIGGISSSFNPFVVSLQAFISSLVSTDFGYVGYSLMYLIGSYSGTEGDVAFLIYTTMFGLAQFVTPISVYMLFGLSFMDVSYKKWLGYIWKFFLGMLVCLLIIFALLTYL